MASMVTESGAGSLQFKGGVRNKSVESPDIMENPVLCYLYNKVDIIPQDALIKIAVDFYIDSVIESAKNLLHETCAKDTRSKVSKRPEKRVLNVTDMVSVLQKININDTPRFVVHDLSRLPPIDMNSLDVSSMAQQKKSLKSNISNANMITGLFKEMESFKSSIEALNLQIADPIVSVNQSKKKEKPETDLPCSVWDIDSRLEVVKQKPENKVMVPVSSALRRSSCMNGDTVLIDANSESSVVVSGIQSEGKPNSYEQGRVENGKAETKENQFKLVLSQNKRRPRKVVYGTSGTGGHQLHSQNRRVSLCLD